MILGIAYKKNVDDMRESPGVFIMQKLQDKGALIEYSDPHVPVFPKIRNYSFDLESRDLTESSLKEFDCVVLTTHHDKFDYDLIEKYASLIIDTRGVFKAGLDNLVKA